MEKPISWKPRSGKPRRRPDPGEAPTNLEHYDLFPTPLGVALAVAAGGALRRLSHFQNSREAETVAAMEHPDAIRDPQCPPLPLLRRQLEEYFRGERRAFHFPLAPRGTPFQRRVWQQLLRIPYGEIRSYGEVAQAVGKPGAARAVGQANHRNAIGIIIPCHRVVAADGTLGGYAGGLERKRWLLGLEGATGRWGPGR